MPTSENNVKIRSVTSNDFLAIQAVKPTGTQASFQKNLRDQELGKVDFLTVEINSELVCAVILKWQGKPTYPEYPDLEDLYTKESARGNGYASLLVRDCERRAKEKGYSKIGLAASINPDCPARKLYAKLGYVHDGKDQYVDGVYNGVKDWVIDLEKDL